MFNAGLAIGIGIAAHAYYVALAILLAVFLVALVIILWPSRSPHPTGAREDQAMPMDG